MARFFVWGFTCCFPRLFLSIGSKPLRGLPYVWFVGMLVLATSFCTAWLHGCSCVGVYGVCVCGYIDQTEPLHTSSDANGGVASPLPWQPSIQPRSPQLSSPLPMKELTTPFPTPPFSLDLSVPATWLDPLRPACSLSPALSPASLTPASRPAAGVSDCDLCVSFSLSECLCPRCRVSQSPSMSQERDTLVQVANSSGEGIWHASASSSLFVSAPRVDFAPPFAHAELASVPKQSPLPFSQKGYLPIHCQICAVLEEIGSRVFVQLRDPCR